MIEWSEKATALAVGAGIGASAIWLMARFAVMEQIRMRMECEKQLQAMKRNLDKLADKVER